MYIYIYIHTYIHICVERHDAALGQVHGARDSGRDHPGDLSKCCMVYVYTLYYMYNV